jgi:multiple sugar transport system permease protein
VLTEVAAEEGRAHGWARPLALIPGFRNGRPRWWNQRSEEIVVGYAFLAPDLIGLVVFIAIPILGAAWISLTDWQGLSDPNFVGLTNYQDAFHDAQFFDSLKVTGLYVGTFVPCLFAISLGLAVLVNQKLRGTTLLRGAYFMPVMLSLVVASVIWSFIFEERAGVLNQALIAVGASPQPWLGSTRLALASVVVVALWQAVGYSMIIFLAGLQDIPQEFYDAAKVDGASALQRFWRITLPLLKPTSAFVLVVTFIGSFQVFDPVYILTNGGPANATSATVFYIFENAFHFFRIGYASALALLLFAVIFVFTVVQLRLFRTEAS